MRLQDKINKRVSNVTGMDVPELGTKEVLSRIEVLKSLNKTIRWWENYAIDMQSSIERIKREHFTDEELYEASK